MTRHQNHGIRKLCDCPRRNWSKCKHSWYLNFKPRGGPAHRFSLDVEAGKHLETKEDADREADRIRTEIRDGSFLRADERRKIEAAKAEAAKLEAEAAKQTATVNATTLDTFAKTYEERVSQVRERNKAWKNDRNMFSQLGAYRLPDGSRLGDKALSAITEDDLEAFMAGLRTKGRAASTRNQYVQLLKASFRWAVKKGYLSRSPISDDSEIIKRGKIAKRHRRLTPDVLDDKGRITTPGEERRLLAVAGPRLQNLIIAALESAARRGELLSLTWGDVNLDRHELTIRAETAKDGDRRVLPISPRLVAVLQMAKTDPAGQEYKADAFVFGEVGQKVDNVKRAWETAVLKAHGHEPTWTASSLSAASRAALKGIDLHFHDLRHEGASRMHEAGWPLHHVQHMLGHANLEQTSTYLNIEKTGLADSMRRFGVPAGTRRCNSVAIEAANGVPVERHDEVENGGKVLIN